MPENRGYYEKYNVYRKDEKVIPDGTRFFVLDLDHDPLARPALLAYIEAGKDQYPELANIPRDLGWE